jgi:lipoprotein-anchoring transpeptidase ErfK/SrfK
MRYLIWLLPVAIVSLLFGILVAAGNSGELARGMSVGNTPVGGMLPKEAYSRVLQTNNKTISSRQAILLISNKKYSVKLDNLGARLNINDAVNKQSSRAFNGSVLTRGYNRLMGQNINQPIEVIYSNQKITKASRRIKNKASRPAQEGELKLSSYGTKIVAGKNGRTTSISQIKKALASSIITKKPQTVRLKIVKPRTTKNKLQNQIAIVVSKKAKTARLYKGTKLIKTYDVAIGQDAYPTPAGLFAIQNKQINPVWSVPNSAWAGSMAGQVVAGGSPENPLVARWLGITDGVGFHGTREENSVGTAASHGCLRMRPTDVIDLYPRVPVGAPILIHN